MIARLNNGNKKMRPCLSKHCNRLAIQYDKGKHGSHSDCQDI